MRIIHTSPKAGYKTQPQPQARALYTIHHRCIPAATAMIDGCGARLGGGVGGDGARVHTYTRRSRRHCRSSRVATSTTRSQASSSLLAGAPALSTAKATVTTTIITTTTTTTTTTTATTTTTTTTTHYHYHDDDDTTRRAYRAGRCDEPRDPTEQTSRLRSVSYVVVAARSEIWIPSVWGLRSTARAGDGRPQRRRRAGTELDRQSWRLLGPLCAH